MWFIARCWSRHCHRRNFNFQRHHHCSHHKSIWNLHQWRKLCTNCAKYCQSLWRRYQSHTRHQHWIRPACHRKTRIWPKCWSILIQTEGKSAFGWTVQWKWLGWWWSRGCQSDRIGWTNPTEDRCQEEFSTRFQSSTEIQVWSVQAETRTSWGYQCWTWIRLTDQLEQIFLRSILFRIEKSRTIQLGIQVQIFSWNHDWTSWFGVWTFWTSTGQLQST